MGSGLEGRRGWGPGAQKLELGMVPALRLGEEGACSGHGDGDGQ